MSEWEKRYSSLRRQVGLAAGLTGLIFFSVILAAALGRQSIANYLLLFMVPPLLLSIALGEKMRKAFFAMRSEQGASRAEVLKDWDKINPPGGG
ncbi:hypothetical protein [Rhabdaerophilum sp. SD176]|uniref:hypothetical protein n=1 Tax=Rhabdaerophilum sp. SD176 TaxID=2983548 RepID=UPI0024E00030|nr:hypothetical protein [Rhabdaerophilum sp. SD176]